LNKGQVLVYQPDNLYKRFAMSFVENPKPGEGVLFPVEAGQRFQFFRRHLNSKDLLICKPLDDLSLLASIERAKELKLTEGLLQFDALDMVLWPE
jgi:hypothetical protein